MNGLKYTVFQLMCECSEMNIEATLKKIQEMKNVVSEKLTIEKYVLYGKRGFKDKIMQEDCMNYGDVGSIQCKMMHSNGNKISVLLFKNGKIKICGGLCQVEMKTDYVNGVVEDVSEFVSGMKSKRYVISLLNAQFKIEMNSKLFRGFLYKVQESKRFFYVKEPPMTGRGNIVCGRVYSYKGRKSHMAISPKGTVQMFAYKTFEEIKESMNNLIEIS